MKLIDGYFAKYEDALISKTRKSYKEKNYQVHFVMKSENQLALFFEKLICETSKWLLIISFTLILAAARTLNLQLVVLIVIQNLFQVGELMINLLPLL